MRNLGTIALLFVLFTNAFNLRTNTRILTSNILDSISTVVHPYRSY